MARYDLNRPILTVPGKYKLPFQWGVVSPFPLIIAAKGLVVNAIVVITTPFNAINTTLSIGDNIDNERLLERVQIDPTQIATFESSPGYRYSSPTEINLYTNLGLGNTQGEGIILINIEA